jgi:hypothetical protein
MVMVIVIVMVSKEPIVNYQFSMVNDHCELIIEFYHQSLSPITNT